MFHIEGAECITTTEWIERGHDPAQLIDEQHHRECDLNYTIARLYNAIAHLVGVVQLRESVFLTDEDRRRISLAYREQNNLSVPISHDDRITLHNAWSRS